MSIATKNNAPKMTTFHYVLLCSLALFVGALIPIQAATNTAMSKAIGSFSLAAFLLFAIGLVFLTLWLLFSRPTFPPLSAYQNVPVYGYLGGIIVASYVLAITFIAPRMGVGNAICFIVSGQILAAVLIDHFGLLGTAVHVLSWQRALGVLLMTVGVFLARR